jgi:16S rRNA (guanine527-N7)-methyltransferase
MDARSGGGYPGIPLKIVSSDLSLTLVDTVRKKVSFLKYVTRTIGLKHVSAVNGRLEDLAELPEYREKFDLVVCRAFSSLDGFVKAGAPFLSPGGSLLAMKGRETDIEELLSEGLHPRPVAIEGTRYILKIEHYRLPFLDAERRLVRLTSKPDVGGRGPGMKV